MTEAGAIFGTALYMSPEQARGAVVDARTDVFSLGVVLIEMATGRVPRDGSLSAAGLSPEFKRIVVRATRADPSDRYQTMKDLLLDLRGWQQRQTTAPVQAQKPSRRIGLLVAAALAGAMVVAGAIVWRLYGTAPAIDSIAVLPFENLTRDNTIDYLSDGITESLIDSLSQLQGVKVIARSSVFS